MTRAEYLTKRKGKAITFEEFLLQYEPDPPENTQHFKPLHVWTHLEFTDGGLIVPCNLFTHPNFIKSISTKKQIGLFAPVVIL